MRTSRWLVATSIAAALAFGCGKKGGGGGDGEGENGDKPADPANPNSGTVSDVIALAGVLGLEGTSLTGDAYGLTAATVYDLFCTTFEDTPKAAKVTVATDGKFNGELKGFALKAFGCFLRADGKTLAPLIFDTDSSVLAGAGVLEIALSFDAKTGKATAKINKATSTALGDAVRAQLDELLAKNKTVLGDLTGTYKLTCDQDADLPCPQDFSQGFNVYMKQFKLGDKDKVAIWESPEARNKCVVNEDETKIKLGFKLGGTVVPVDLNNRKAFEASVDTVYGAMSADLQKAIKDRVASFGENRYRHCEFTGGANSSPFRANNCKLVVPADVTHKGIDPNGNEFTFTVPGLLDKAGYDAATTVEGVVEETVECVVEFEPGVNKPQCPPDIANAATGPTATMKRYTKDGKQVFLACVDSFDTTKILQHPASGVTVEAAVASFGGGGGGGAPGPGEECTKITDGTYAGLRSGDRDEVRRAVIELMNFDEERAQHECQGDAAIAADFTWKKCEGMDQNMPRFCYSKHIFEFDLGLSVNDAGQLVPKADPPPFFDAGQHKRFCPDTVSDFEGAPMANPQDFRGPCRTEFLQKFSTPVKQAELLREASYAFVPPATAIFCGASEAIKTELASAQAGSCSAEVFFDHACGPTGCELTLRCSGSSAGGKCFDKDGLFAGRVNGRHAVMDLKLRVAGAFELSEVSADRFIKYENEQQVECRFAHSTVIGALKKSDTVFSGTFTSGEKQECDEAEAKSSGMMMSGMMTPPGGPTSTATSGPGPGGPGGPGPGGPGPGPQGGGDKGGSHSESFKVTFTKQ